MKKVIQILIFVLIIMIIALGIFIYKLSGYTNDEENDITPNAISVNNVDTENEDLSEYDEQIDIIAQNIELWTESKDYADDLIQFAITDLDKNGRLEVVFTQMGGSGRFSYNSFFEIDEKLSTLKKCSFKGENDYSEADLSLSDEVDVYYDNKTEKFFYIVTDELKISPNEYFEGIYAISLKDGEIEEDYIASKNIFYDYENDNEEVITYSDKFQNFITKDEYDSVANNFYNGLEKSTLKLNWKDVSEIENITDENSIINILKSSLSL